jgi:hypothetical protein
VLLLDIMTRGFLSFISFSLGTNQLYILLNLLSFDIDLQHFMLEYLQCVEFASQFRKFHMIALIFILSYKTKTL